MKTDLYTKTILTVIASALVWMCLNGRSIVPAAQAQTPQPTSRPTVALFGWIDGDGIGHPFDKAPLPVRVVPSNRPSR